MNRLEITPLKAVPFAEALDAPGMTFTTSPELPWSAYQLPASAGFDGNHAAFGGSHNRASDPWIETKVAGPGILRSTTAVHAFSMDIIMGTPSNPRMMVDGVLVNPDFAPSELLLSQGFHTISISISGPALGLSMKSILLICEKNDLVYDIYDNYGCKKA